jgi:hypothetical protein
MKYLVLILVPTFLLISAPDTRAHKLVTVNGNAQEHQHAYRRQEYGKPLQQGHVYQSAGGGSVTIWNPGNQFDYGKVNGRRDGPIIGDRKPRRGGKQGDRKKFGSAVKDYGKPIRGYGSR